MSFTDEDLKKLKMELIGHDVRLVTPLRHEYPEMPALLARLEAAELKSTFAHEPHAETCKSRQTVWRTTDGRPRCDCGFEAAHEAWRKAAGK